MLGRVRGILDRKTWARRLESLAERYGLALSPFAKSAICPSASASGLRSSNA